VILGSAREGENVTRHGWAGLGRRDRRLLAAEARNLAPAAGRRGDAAGSKTPGGGGRVVELAV